MTERLNWTAWRLQCWHALAQTTNRAGTQPYLSADRVLKVFLSTQLPTKHNPWHDPAYQRTRLSPPVGRNQSLSQGSLHSLWENLIHQGAESRSKNNYKPAEQKLQSQKGTQNETAKERVPDEGTGWNPRRTVAWSGGRQTTWRRI